MNEETKAAAIANATAWSGFGISKWLSAVGIHSWGDFSGLCASIVSILFVADWIRKKWKARKRKGQA